MSKGIITIEQRQKQIISRLKKENQRLRIRIGEMEKENISLREKLENVLLHLSELEEIIFGKKKKKKENDKDDSNTGSSSKGNPRDKSSYSRPTPSKEEITDIEEHKIDICPDCGTALTKKQIITRYIEDIRLACFRWIG